MKKWLQFAGSLLVLAAVSAPAQRLERRQGPPVDFGGEVWAQKREKRDDRGRGDERKGGRFERREESREDRDQGFGNDQNPFGRGRRMKPDRDHPGEPGKRHVGSWLRKYQDVPAAEQERALKDDPDFQRLPSHQQDRLRERLRQFNNLPPQQRERMLERMDTFQHLAPEQRQRLSGHYRDLRELPKDRRKAVRRAFEQLRGMDPEQRDRALNSDRFRNNFNDRERDTLRGLLELFAAGASVEDDPQE